MQDMKPRWEEETPFRQREGGIELRVRVNPRSSRRCFRGIEGGALRFDLNSPPVEGAANRELADLLAEMLGVPRGKVRILRGEKSRDKLLGIDGIDEETLRAALQARKR